MKILTQQSSITTIELNKMDSEKFEMSYENRYKIFPLEIREKYIEQLYDPYRVFGKREVVLKNTPKYQGSDRKDGYIMRWGEDENGLFHAIFLPTEQEYDKIRKFAEIEEKRKKMSVLASLQSKLTHKGKTLSDLKLIEQQIDELYEYIFIDKEPSELIEEPIDVVDSIINIHDNIFSSNGFKLFKYILENYIAEKGMRGRYADISFYYWKMYEDEPQYIHQRPEPFRLWFCKEYDEDFEKIRVLNNVKNSNREKHYSSALEWFKSKVQR